MANIKERNEIFANGSENVERRRPKNKEDIENFKVKPKRDEWGLWRLLEIVRKNKNQEREKLEPTWNNNTGRTIKRR